MNKKCHITPMSVYSVRLDQNAVLALKLRARERGLPVAMVLRNIINDYLIERDADDAISEMETRMVASIDRLTRTQLQVRRVADISVAQNEYIRRTLDLMYAKRTPGEDLKETLSRNRATFLEWLPRSLTTSGIVRQMIRLVMEPLPERSSSETPMDQEEGTSNG